MSSFLALDILTFLRLLVIGNLVAMVMVFAYRSPGNHAAPIAASIEPVKSVRW